MTQGPFYPLGRGEEMSEGAYQASQVDPEWDEAADLVEHEGRWQTKDNGVVLIRDMTDAHVLNAINWMHGRGLDNHPKLAELIAERDRRHL